MKVIVRCRFPWESLIACYAVYVLWGMVSVLIMRMAKG